MAKLFSAEGKHVKALTTIKMIDDPSSKIMALAEAGGALRAAGLRTDAAMNMLLQEMMDEAASRE
jgi:hypothetical protein